MLLASKGDEARDAVTILQGTGQPPPQRSIQLQMSVMLRMRKPGHKALSNIKWKRKKKKKKRTRNILKPSRLCLKMQQLHY